jgi:gluconolactonase
MTSQERRYPDPSVRVLDPRFKALTIASASVECLYQGARWSEGPVWFGDARYLLWSDIPNNRILRWDEATGEVGTFRQPSNNANGHTRDREGRFVSCEHLTRRVTRTEYDGSITVLADRFDGKPLNSPNDVIVKSDGSIWFSDPTFGIDGFYEGEKAEPQLKPGVYRVDAQNGEVSLMIDDFVGPNGLAFSPDESILYVGDSGANHEVGSFVPGRPHHVRAFDVLDGKRLANSRLFATITPGFPDGIKVDADGRVYVSCFSGVQVFAPDGEQVDEIQLPAAVNFAFAASALLITTDTAIWAAELSAKGA